MIERIQGLPDTVVGVRTEGRVTREDYDRVIGPAIDQARAGGGKIRLLYHMGPGFDGLTAGAVLDDAMLGMKHLTAFEKIAVVTDVDWVTTAVRMFGMAIPCPVSVFKNAELDAARAWILS